MKKRVLKKSKPEKLNAARVASNLLREVIFGLDPLARPVFTVLILIANPLINAEQLLKRCKEGDKAAMQQALELLEDGVRKEEAAHLNSEVN